jgi:hypothetical protein
MNTQLFIPKKIKVGYVKRDDTYTKKLGYVIYYDNKNVLRKETSWNTWRDDKIPFDDFENVPTSGFVLNKKVGGDKYSWNTRQTYTRVYDPRGFEFEISIPNLLFILQECDCTKGKGLEGEFVYSWEGKELVLLPAQSTEYKQCLEYTDLQSEKIKAKDLKIGYTYMDNRQNQYVYLGKYDVHYHNYSYYRDPEESQSKEFVFINIVDIDNSDPRFHTIKAISTIKKEISESQIENFAEILQKFINSPISSPFSHVEYIDLPDYVLDGNYVNIYVYSKLDQKRYQIWNYRGDTDTYTVDDCKNYSNRIQLTKSEILGKYCIRYAVFANNSKIKTY